MPSTCARVSGSSRSSHPLKWPSAGAGWLKKPRAGEPYLRTKSSAGRQGLVAKIVAPALPSTSRSAEATCGVGGDQGAPGGASACINSQARTVPLGARVTATWNGFCFVRGRWLEREHGARLHGGALDLAQVRHPILGE